jgi:hypothetical protein
MILLLTSFLLDKNMILSNMAAPMLCSRLFCRSYKYTKKSYVLASYCTSKSPEGPQGSSKEVEETHGAPKVSNIVKAFQKFDQIAHDQKHEQGQGLEKEDDNESFASMIRRSKLLQLGKPEGKIVSGHVFEVFEDDLYIDFGGKFHCVCPRPAINPEYVAIISQDKKIILYHNNLI